MVEKNSESLENDQHCIIPENLSEKEYKQKKPSCVMIFF